MVCGSFKNSAIVAALLLAGCGGGSDDSTSTTTTTTTTTTVQPVTVPLTISGKATDSPIANADISVIISGQEEPVTATADADGNYSATLNIAESQMDAFISIIAKGVGEQQVAGLISLLGSVSKLSEQAGEDHTLTSDENFSVQVTNITTAQYALLNAANNNGEITTDEQLEELKTEISAQEVIQLATAIKVAIDKATGNANLSLPNEVADTFALVQNLSTAKEYVSKVQEDEAYQQAEKEIFEDENLFSSGTYVIPSDYYFAPECEICSSRGSYTFNADGTGTWFEPASKYERSKFAIRWEEEGGLISISFDSPLSYTYSNYYGIEITDHLENMQLRKMDSSDLFDTIQFSRTWTRTSTNSSESTTYDHLIVAYKQHTSLIGFVGGKAVIPMHAPLQTAYSDSLGADILTLNSDGSGSTAISQQAFTWQSVEGKLVVTGDAPDFSLIISQLGEQYILTEKVENLEVTAGKISADVINRVLDDGTVKAELPEWNSAAVAGIYTYDNAVFNNPLDSFWIELSEDGTAKSISTYDHNSNGALTSDEVAVWHGEWEIDSNGKLTISRYKYGCDPKTSFCELYHIREWTLFGQYGTRFDVFHRHHWIDTDAEAYDNRSLFKVTEAPITLPENTGAKAAKLVAKPSTMTNANTTKASRFAHLEPNL